MKRTPSKRSRPVIGGFTLAVPFVLAASPALAYVGPGAGITMLGALWGLIVAVVAAIAFLVMWPLRRYIFKSKGKRTAGHAKASRTDSPAARQAEANPPRPS